jgi:hypothetical protein
MNPISAMYLVTGAGGGIGSVSRYDRAAGDVEQITGQAAQTVEQYVASNPDLFY